MLNLTLCCCWSNYECWFNISTLGGSFGVVVTVLVTTTKVCRARLVLGLITTFVWSTIPALFQATQPHHPFAMSTDDGFGHRQGRNGKFCVESALLLYPRLSNPNRIKHQRDKLCSNGHHRLWVNPLILSSILMSSINLRLTQSVHHIHHPLLWFFLPSCGISWKHVSTLCAHAKPTAQSDISLL